MRTELEALLLYAAPRELLIAEPLSSATSKMLGAFVSASAGVRAETVQRDTFRDGGARAAVVAFYGEHDGVHSTSALSQGCPVCHTPLALPSSRATDETEPTIACRYISAQLRWAHQLVEAQSRWQEQGIMTCVVLLSAGKGGAAGVGAADAVAQLPGLVLQALAHALDYLRPFGLEAVLRLQATFREFSAKSQMQLLPNALRYCPATPGSLRSSAWQLGSGCKASSALHRAVALSIIICSGLQARYGLHCE